MLQKIVFFSIFDTLVEEMKSSGNRPIRFRPFTIGDSVSVAVVWTRNNRNWKLKYGQPVEELQDTDSEMQLKGYLPVDAACYFDHRKEP